MTLAPEPGSAAVARRFFRAHRCPRQDPDQVDIAVLLVSELVTNAILHGAPPIVLELRCDADHALQVRVTDAGPALPTTRQAGADDAGGRGLSITELLSDGWGIDPRQDGKTVWFRLLLHEERQEAGPG